MGQYLAIGLSTHISVRRQELEQAQWAQEELIARMRDELTLPLDNYQLDARAEELVWALRPDLLASELIPLLRALYPALYPQPGGENDSEAVLQGLAERPPDQWLSWAEDKPHYSFQADRYGSSDYLDAKFGRSIGVHYLDILLSMEGKVIMEAYGRQFRFWQQCMAHRFADFALARSLRIYLTG